MNIPPLDPAEAERATELADRHRGRLFGKRPVEKVLADLANPPSLRARYLVSSTLIVLSIVAIAVLEALGLKYRFVGYVVAAIGWLVRPWGDPRTRYLQDLAGYDDPRCIPVYLAELANPASPVRRIAFLRLSVLFRKVNENTQLALEEQHRKMLDCLILVALDVVRIPPELGSLGAPGHGESPQFWIAMREAMVRSLNVLRVHNPSHFFAVGAFTAFAYLGTPQDYAAIEDVLEKEDVSADSVSPDPDGGDGTDDSTDLEAQSSVAGGEPAG